MKKVIFMLAAVLCTMTAMATEYTGKLTVSVNGEGGSMATKIQITEVDGKYNLDLNNFCLAAADDDVMGIGNINLHGIVATEDFGFKNIKFTGDILITEGDLQDVELWMGPLLGEVPLVMTADFNDTTLSVNIDINMMESIGQVINVNFVGCAPAQGGIKGDVNADNIVDINDVNSLINILLGGK